MKRLLSKQAAGARRGMTAEGGRCLPAAEGGSALDGDAQGSGGFPSLSTGWERDRVSREHDKSRPGHGCSIKCYWINGQRGFPGV